MNQNYFSCECWQIWQEGLGNMGNILMEKRLLDAAVQTFYDKGYHQATISDIAKLAGVSKGGMFHYFTSKSKVLFELMVKFVTILESGLEEELQGIDDPTEKLKVFIRRHLMLCIENMVVAKVYLHEKQYIDPDDFSALKLLEERYLQVCRDILKEIEACKLSGSSLDPTTSLFALFGMCNWLYTWYDPQAKITPEKLCDDFIEIYVNGLIR